MPIQHHNSHIDLENDAILWRYMSLAKYESLLKQQALFFCRADKFSDPYECSIPKREFEFRLSREKFEEQERAFGRYDSVFDPKIAKQKADDLAVLHKKVRTATTVNCWHINNYESDAMWQLYLKDNQGLAVRTNKKKLYAALENAKQKISISKVRYINYETDIWYHETEFPVAGYNFYTPVMHKKIEFQHERELRLYHHDSSREKDNYWDSQTNTVGELIPVDVSTLIESVIFHPTADKGAKDKIINLTRACGHEFKYETSKLSIEPYY